MSSVIRPRHVLCVLGRDLDLDLVAKVCGEVGGPGFTLDREYSQQEPDPRMVNAFRACLTNLTFTDADWEAVRTHDRVAYVMSPPMPPGTGLAVSRRMLAVVAALLNAGATAAKSESSGIAHGRDRWLELAEFAADSLVPTVALYHAWVKRPISDDNLLYSCGMHLLDAPDVELQLDPDSPASVDDRCELIDGLATYRLTEERGRAMRDGERFRLAADAPPWLLRHRGCDRYDDDDLFFNPYGYWRLTPA